MPVQKVTFTNETNQGAQQSLIAQAEADPEIARVLAETTVIAKNSAFIYIQAPPAVTHSTGANS
jgi:hypothetical protein